MSSETSPPPTLRLRVGVAITRGDHLLLMERPRESGTGYVLPGGAVAAGESLTATARRHCTARVALDVTPNEVIVVAETRNRAQATQCLHIVFDVAAWSGVPTAGSAEATDGVLWYPLERLEEVDLYPPVAAPLLAALRHQTHGLHVIGDLWHELS